MALALEAERSRSEARHRATKPTWIAHDVHVLLMMRTPLGDFSMVMKNYQGEAYEADISTL